MGELKRELGLVGATVMGVGVILGAGIYALVGKAAALGGNAVWLSFVAAAVVASFTGLSYAELASFIPRAGGEYHYARRAFGSLVAFLVAWMLLGGMCVATGAVALGFGGYLHALTDLPVAAGAAMVLSASVGLLLWGVKESVWVASFATLLEVVGLLAVIAVGLPHLGEVALLEPGPTGYTGVAGAAALIFFAYIGFEEIVQLAEETRDPTRNVPLALVLSIAITTVLYVLVALAAISVVGWERLGASDSPLTEVFAEVGWHSGAAIALIALFSTGNTVLILLLSCSRLLYGMAEDGVLPAALARVGDRRGTPWVATLAVLAVAGTVALVFEDIESVANLTNLALFTTFLAMNAAVIALRFKEPDTPRPFRLPVDVAGVPVVPVLGIFSVVLLAAQVGVEALVWGAGLLGLGVVAWVLRRPATP